MESRALAALALVRGTVQLQRVTAQDNAREDAGDPVRRFSTLGNLSGQRESTRECRVPPSKPHILPV